MVGTYWKGFNIFSLCDYDQCNGARNLGGLSLFSSMILLLVHKLFQQTKKNEIQKYLVSSNITDSIEQFQDKKNQIGRGILSFSNISNLDVLLDGISLGILFLEYHWRILLRQQNYLQSFSVGLAKEKFLEIVGKCRHHD